MFEQRSNKVFTKILKRILINSMKRSSEVLLRPMKWKWMGHFFFLRSVTTKTKATFKTLPDKQKFVRLLLIMTVYIKIS